MSSSTASSSPPTPASLRNQQAMTKSGGDAHPDATAGRVELDKAGQGCSPPGLHPLSLAEPLNAARQPPPSSLSSCTAVAPEHHAHSSGAAHGSHSPSPPSPFHLYLHSQQQPYFVNNQSNPQHLQLPPMPQSGNYGTHSDAAHHYHSPSESHGGVASHQVAPLVFHAIEHEHREHYSHNNSMVSIPQPSPYYASYHHQSVPPSPATASSGKEHGYPYQHGTVANSPGGKKMTAYHPYYFLSQQQQQQQVPVQMTSSSRSPNQMDFVTSAPIKPSSIFTPNAHMLPDVRYGATDGSAPNYGRLPNGKIIELYPAMMRTIQACEYCRSRKAKCSGGLPCERCAKKNVKCEYAQLDKKRKVKTTTSDYDMSGGANSSAHGNGSSYPVNGSANNSGKRSNGGGSGGVVNAGKSRSLKKLNRAIKPIVAADPHDVPMTLSPSSPFTPVSLLYRGDEQREPAAEETFDLHRYNALPAQPTMDTLASRYSQRSPSSTASHSSGGSATSGLPFEATTSPKRKYSALSLSKRGYSPGLEEGPSSPNAQESAFYRRDPYAQTSFF